MKLSDMRKIEAEFDTSPPSRGAWIEIFMISGAMATKSIVAPLAGGVD